MSAYTFIIVIKQLTALILVLALANPFCCCLSMSLLGVEEPTSAAMSTELVNTVASAQVRSCCSTCVVSTSTTSSEEGHEGKSDKGKPSFPQACECDQVYTAADVINFKPLKPIVIGRLPATVSIHELMGLRLSTRLFCVPIPGKDIMRELKPAHSALPLLYGSLRT